MSLMFIHHDMLSSVVSEDTDMLVTLTFNTVEAGKWAQGHGVKTIKCFFPPF